MTASIPRDGWVLRRGDADYPAALEDLPDPPARLFGRGAAEALRLPSLSIVGTRRITPYGEALCELAAQIAVESGLAVVSGGALGCDMVAGRKVLDAGGVHIVVLGTGADVAYPARNAGLFEEAIRRGYADWNSRQVFLHVIMEHAELDEAEVLFSAAFAACDEQDGPDFHAAMAQLNTQLHLLAETQAISVKNIL